MQFCLVMFFGLINLNSLVENDTLPCHSVSNACVYLASLIGVLMAETSVTQHLS